MQDGGTPSFFFFSLFPRCSLMFGGWVDETYAFNFGHNNLMELSMEGLELRFTVLTELPLLMEEQAWS